jgi:molecular chaperone DnaJ
MHRDYYATLSVARDAEAKTIKSAFRKLALQYHPDRNKEPGAEDRFKEIAEAYAVLSDPEKRAAFDAGEARGASVQASDEVFSDIDFHDLFYGLGFDFAGMGHFDRFVRQRQRARAVRGADLEVEIAVPLERVASGGEQPIRMTRPAVCTACRGSGAQSDTRLQRCAACDGRGERVLRWRQGGLILQQVVACSTCHGQGHLNTAPCATCRGGGMVDREATLHVTIPIGVEEGMILRLPGQGVASPDAGGAPGDLFVVVHIAPDTRFERRDVDLWQTVTISVVDSVLGTQVDVPTLQGSRRMAIPTGTQPETVLRLRHQGLPEFGGQSRGSMYVRVRVHVPDRLTPEEREIYEHLRTSSQGKAESESRQPEAPSTPGHNGLARQHQKGWFAALLRMLRNAYQRWRGRLTRGEG